MRAFIWLIIGLKVTFYDKRKIELITVNSLVQTKIKPYIWFFVTPYCDVTFQGTNADVVKITELFILWLFRPALR